jgi:hypothetical protein
MMKPSLTSSKRPSKELAAKVCHAGVATLSGRVRGRVTYSQARNTPFQGLAADGAALRIRLPLPLPGAIFFGGLPWAASC